MRNYSYIKNSIQSILITRRTKLCVLEKHMSYLTMCIAFQVLHICCCLLLLLHSHKFRRFKASTCLNPKTSLQVKHCIMHRDFSVVQQRGLSSLYVKSNGKQSLAGESSRFTVVWRQQKFEIWQPIRVWLLVLYT